LIDFVHIGKTYSALKVFQMSTSGVYCGPLKLLASEVFNKTNQLNTRCDLITGEERKFANEDQSPSQHAACTVEMVNLDKEYEVAVIDEIQLISDLQRGWAWTRAFLGLAAKEIHVCGDMTAVDIISDLAFLCGDTLEIKNYKRLTQLIIMEKYICLFSVLLTRFEIFNIK
jgi:ATP-dependent RNA helicase SUPV3L1/SUV3